MSLWFNFNRQLAPNIKHIYRMSNSAAYNVVHDQKKRLFFITLEKGTALLEYHIDDNNIMDMYHTETPPAYRGQGLAKHVVREAMDYARSNHLNVKPTCTYVLKYVQENPDPDLKIVSL